MTDQQDNAQSPNQELGQEKKEIDWEQAMKNMKKYNELSSDPLTPRQMTEMRYSMNRDWERALKMDSPKREEKMFFLLFTRFHYLNNHLKIWAEHREDDRRWKEDMESRLDSFMEQATGVLDNLSEQARMIMEGESSGDMMKLVLGTLNELRDRVSGLENILGRGDASGKI